jgi:predicted transglutaminase-like cysteine proteinase
MKYSRLQALACACAVLTAAWGPARAQEAGAFMAIGEGVAPPAGFVALCETSPQDCAGPGASSQDLADVRLWAGRARWSLVFGAAGLASSAPEAPAAAPAPAVTLVTVVTAKPNRTSTAVRAAKDGARKTALAKPKRKTRAKPPAVAPRSPAPAPDPVPQAQTSDERPTVRELEAVNRQINRAIRRGTDQEVFGRSDVWNAPTGPNARGDCEDYVLAKRRALIEAGVDPAGLSIAIVRTRRGEGHAVLIAATADGEYVLDNLSPWVVRWDQAPYDWLERQAPGAALTWVRPVVS